MENLLYDERLISSQTAVRCELHLQAPEGCSAERTVPTKNFSPTPGGP
jgi:hypothetical protein